ncbi:MAG: peptidylprolyl isomerase [Flavobacteriaceae bacterium]
MSKFYFLIILLILVLISCKKEEKKTSFTKQNNSTVKIIKAEKKPVNKDSLNNKNAVAYFTEYGKQNKETQVIFITRHGDITIKLYKNTPLHRASFIFLTKIGYFSTTCFHRVVNGFIAQGGNSENRETVNIRNKYKHYTLPPEFRKNRKHKRGALAIARDWEDNPKKLSTPFEFYFIQSKGEHHLNNEHTVFGEVIKGMHVIDRIVKEDVDVDEWPFTDVLIEAKVIK